MSAKTKDNPEENKTQLKKPQGHNLNGRPKGVKNKSTLLKEALKGQFEDLLEKDGKRVFKAVVDKAVEGDMTAAKLILDRIIPVTDVSKGSGTDKFNISINVQGIDASIEMMDSKPISVSSDVVDAEFIEIEEE